MKELNEKEINGIRLNPNKVNWYNISSDQVLSEDFIREFKDDVDWLFISVYQVLSESFIREFQDDVNWHNISRYQELSEDFIREFNLTDYNDKCIYTNESKELKDFVVEDGYVYGYKAVRCNRYSKYNFQYQYLDSAVYEAFADKTDAESSFGLNLGTLDYAKNYAEGSDIILEVRCKLSDIARVVHDGDKIRAYRIEVLKEYKN